MLLSFVRLMLFNSFSCYFLLFPVSSCHFLSFLVALSSFMIFSGYFTLFYIVFMLMLVCIISYYFYVVEWNLSDIIPCYFMLLHVI